MDILIAPDSFKGSLTANQFIDILSGKLKKLKPTNKIIHSPLADGGEGSLDVLAQKPGFEVKKVEVYNPFFSKITAWYLFETETKTAYIEMAKASGLIIIDKPDVMNASSFGTGELIKHAIENWAKKIILFIGGSATNDAGIGIANALNINFLDIESNLLKPIGKNLLNIHSIDDSNSILRQNPTEILIAADVNNPFYGKNGASYIYAPQKGANQNEVIALDNGLRNISNLFSKYYNTNVHNIKGSGAAGGIGGGMIAMFNAKIISGSDLIFKLTGIENQIKMVDLVITGEGKIDNQTINDKLIFKLTKLARKHNKKVWAVCGYFDGDEELRKLLGIEKIFSLAKSKNEINNAIKNAEIKLAEATNKITEAIKHKK
ncbi:MAG: hypothetical protein B6I20_13945 [Bacteroidetes bacterium 4572_117]|nr:MAG: hypothetical protein B6I20_13945 [Bacteroidetes bacterium 4572_117]